MTDYRKCPYRTVTRPADAHCPEEIALCGALESRLGWPAGVLDSICRQCAEAGEPGGMNSRLQSVIKDLLIIRIETHHNNHLYPAERTPGETMDRLIREKWIPSPEAAVAILEQAVKDGMPPEEAAAIMEEVSDG